MALSLGLSQATHAAPVTVFNNGAPNQVYGVNVSDNVVAEDFTIGATTNITNIRFWSLQSNASDYSGSLTFTIYGNAGGSPGAVLYSGLSAAAANPTFQVGGFGYDEYVFDITTAFQLSAGNYWLGLANSPLNPANPSEMLWETTAPGFGSQAKYFNLDPFAFGWQSALQDLAFRIEGDLVQPGTVPEPGTLALVALALAGAGFQRRKA